MMISPEGYYEEYLKGKNEKQIMTAIRGLRQKMGKLKRTMENIFYGSESIIEPSASIRLQYTRMYLDRAKQALIDVGGSYTPSRAELKSELFDASIPAIYRVIFSIGGFFGGYETRTITLNEKHLHLDVEHTIKPKPSNLPIVLDYPHGKENFLAEIRELHLGEWHTSYWDLNFLDGTQWDLTIEFSDKHKPFKTGGSNEFPYNFNALDKLLDIDLDEEHKDNDE